MLRIQGSSISGSVLGAPAMGTTKSGFQVVP